jgi:hypothetical protein
VGVRRPLVNEFVQSRLVKHKSVHIANNLSLTDEYNFRPVSVFTVFRVAQVRQTHFWAVPILGDST